MFYARLMQTFVAAYRRMLEWVVKRPRFIFWVNMALPLACLAGLMPFIRIEADVAAVFPDGRPEVDAFRGFISDFGQAEPTFVVIKDEDEVLDIDDLVDLFTSVEGVRQVVSGPDLQLMLPAIKAITRYPASFLQGSNRDAYLQALRQDSSARFQTIRDRLGSINVEEERTLLRLDPTGVLQFVDFEMDVGEGPLVVRDSAYWTPDLQRRVLLITPEEPAFDGAFAKRFIDSLDRAIASLDDKNEAYYFSGHLYAVSDAQGIRSGITRTLFVSLILLIILFRFAYGHWAAFFVPLPAVLWGVVTAAAVMIARGSALNILTASFASVVMGLGVDVAVHVMSVVDWRSDQAIERLLGLLRPLLAAMTTTVGAFFSLMLVDVPVMREMGLLCGIGVAVAQIMSLVLVPAGQLTFSIKPDIKNRTSLITRLMEWAGNAPRIIALAVFLVGLLIASRILKLPYEADLRQLRHKSLALENAEQNFARDFASLPETLYWYIEAEDYNELYKNIASDYARLVDAGYRLSPNPLAVLPNPEAESMVLEVPWQDWPQALNREAFEWPSQTSGNEDVWSIPGYQQLVSSMLIRQPNRCVFGQRFTLTGDMREVELDHGELTSVPALQQSLTELLKSSSKHALQVLAPVLFLVLWIGLRRLKHVAMVAVALLLAVGLTLGLLQLAGGAISLANLAVVPLLLGIGIDDAIHMAVWLDNRDRMSHWQGSARGILMTTLSTMIGFGALVLAPYPALQQMGLLVDIGLVACLFSTVFFIPLMAKSRA